MSRSTSSPRGMKTFLIIWTGQLISLIGSGLTSFALGVWIYQQTGQATPFALTALFSALPRILLAPVAGSLADRWNRRRMMILADTGDALVTLVAALLLASGQLVPWHIYLIAIVGAAFAAFQEPAYAASIAMLVPKKDLARANGLVQMGRAMEMVISPLLAGLLFGVVGMSGIILTDFCTYFFAIGALLFVHIPQPQVAPAEGGGERGTLLGDFAFGWRYLHARPGLFGLLLYFALVNFSLNFAAVLIGPLVLTFGTSSTLGLVHTVSGVGMLVGSVVMSAWGGPKRRIWGVIGFITLAAWGLLAMGVHPSAVFVGAGMCVLTFCVPLASGPSQAIFQTKVTPAVQGRVFAARGMISRSMMPLAFLTVGPMADYLFEPSMREGGILASTFIGSLIGIGPGRGMGLMFILSGLSMIGASIVAIANRRIRLVEDELPDVTPDAAGEDQTPAAETPSLAPRTWRQTTPGDEPGVSFRLRGPSEPQAIGVSASFSLAEALAFFSWPSCALGGFWQEEKEVWAPAPPAQNRPTTICSHESCPAYTSESRA